MLTRKASAYHPVMVCTMVADDERPLRWSLRDLRLDQRLAQIVAAPERGAELLAKVTEHLCAEKASREQNSSSKFRVVPEVIFARRGKSTSRSAYHVDRLSSLPDGFWQLRIIHSLGPRSGDPLFPGFTAASTWFLLSRPSRRAGTTRDENRVQRSARTGMKPVPTS